MKSDKRRSGINVSVQFRCAGVQLQQPGIQPEEMDGVSERNETAS